MHWWCGMVIFHHETSQFKEKALPETNIAPENWWLEDEISSWDGRNYSDACWSLLMPVCCWIMLYCLFCLDHVDAIFQIKNHLRRHAPGSVKVHLKYGRLTLVDVKKAIDRADEEARGKMCWSAWSTYQLRNAHRGIENELNKRKASATFPSENGPAMSSP